jgi:ribosomal protein S18 acetylase RimI-like enzyme
VEAVETSIRPFLADDESEVVAVWHRSGRAAYPFLANWQALSLEDAVEVFRATILARNEVWVCTQAQRVVGFLAIQGSYLDRMYVAPEHWRTGCGEHMLDFAKALSPSGLELHTHQANSRARAFYERHGFTVVELGRSPAPESAPDVKYEFRPRASTH